MVTGTAHYGGVSYSLPQRQHSEAHATMAVCGTENPDEVQVQDNFVIVLSPRDSWDPYDIVFEVENPDGESTFKNPCPSRR